MIRQPSISIVTVVKNSLPLLKRTIESVNLQRNKNFEYLIIDGASTDATRDYVLSLPSPVTKAISEPDKGIYDAMNKSVHQCSGDYVQFLNAGDMLFSSDSLDKILSYLDGDSDVVIFSYEMDRKVYFPRLTLRRLIGGMPCHQAIFYKREVLLCRPFNLNFHFCSDYEHLLDSIFRLTVTIAPPVAVIYDTTGVSSSKKVARFIRFERARAAFFVDMPFSWKIPIILYNWFRGVL